MLKKFKACFDVRHSVTFWNRMSLGKEKKQEINLNANNEVNISEYFSTHPASQTRSTHLESHLGNVNIY